MDHCLSCPGVGMLTLYAAEITDRSIDRMASLLEASGWDLNSLGNNGTITLMVPKNFGFEAVFQTKEDWDRILLDSRWRGHVRAILRSCILDEALNTTQMKQRFNAGDVKLTTMSGEQKVLGYNEDSDSLTFSHARISFSDIVGVDG